MVSSTGIHPPPHSEIAVAFNAVFFAYGEVPVLENVSFHIHRGEFAALAGPNGSGKTTIIKLILGLEEPGEGTITLFGSAKRAGRVEQALYSRLGYVPQQAPADRAFPIQVRDVVRMGLLSPSRAYGAEARSAVDAAMEQADITELASRSWGALSGGQRRRVLVARALAARPELLVLDEPTANMDVESEARLFETLGKLKGGTTILIVTHDMHFVSALTERVLCLGDNARRREIVQHRVETAAGESRHGESNTPRARILHGENIPADNCCER